MVGANVNFGPEADAQAIKRFDKFTEVMSMLDNI
jgi:hypothetical protein